MVVTGVAVDDIQILHLLEMMLGSIGRVDRGDTRIEAAAENSRQTGLLKALAVGPLPAVFEMSLVLRLVVGCIEIATTAGQTGIHDGQVLVG